MVGGWLYLFWLLILSPDEWVRGLAWVVLFFAVVSMIAATANYIVYFRHWQMEDYASHQAALSVTADSLMLEKAAGVHPETLRLLLGERSRAWMRRAGSEVPDREPYAVMYACPQVTEYFVRYFLINSSETKAMTVRGFLVEGRKKKFDPMGETDEYTMYHLFESVLIQNRMLTKPYNGTPGLWIPPWGPAEVAADLGIGLEEEEGLGQDEETVSLNADGLLTTDVMRA
jgi:hypothetical protein